ncbi:hypothetical protein AB0M79_36120 [Polymorphospora sp. NPDC051019]|uniref:hypothetical protein n=1 Tax=Polymorphospora sp. NPDC051019 TaxID=3155725 RepID=UPI0034401FCB
MDTLRPATTAGEDRNMGLVKLVLTATPVSALGQHGGRGSQPAAVDRRLDPGGPGLRPVTTAGEDRKPVPGRAAAARAGPAPSHHGLLIPMVT